MWTLDEQQLSQLSPFDRFAALCGVPFKQIFDFDTFLVKAGLEAWAYKSLTHKLVGSDALPVHQNVETSNASKASSSSKLTKEEKRKLRLAAKNELSEKKKAKLAQRYDNKEKVALSYDVSSEVLTRVYRHVAKYRFALTPSLRQRKQRVSEFLSQFPGFLTLNHSSQYRIKAAWIVTRNLPLTPLVERDTLPVHIQQEFAGCHYTFNTLIGDDQIFNRYEQFKTFLEVMAKRCERGTMPSFFSTTSLVKYAAGGKLFKARNFNALLRAMRIEYAEPAVAQNALTDALPSVFEGIKSLLTQASQMRKDYPLLVDVTGYSIAFALAYFCESPIFKVGGVVLGSYMLSTRVSEVLATLELPKAQANFDVFSAWHNGMKVLLGLEYDEMEFKKQSETCRSLSNVYHLSSKLASGLANFLVFISRMFPYLYEKITKRKWVERTEEELKGDFYQAQTYLRGYVAGTVKRDEEKLVEAISLYKNAFKEFDSTWRSYAQTTKDYLITMQQIVNHFNLSVKTGTRLEPVHINFTGQPGDGKSLTATPLCEAFNLLCRQQPNSIYLPAPGEYHEHYTGQNSVIIDDIGQAKDQTVFQANMLDLFMMLSSVPYPMTAAAVELKGKKFFSSNLVVTTTNHNMQFLSEGVAVPAAFIRRVHIQVQVERLDIDPMNTTVRILDGSRLNFVGLRPGQIITFEELARAAFGVYTEHKRVFDAITTRSPEFYDAFGQIPDTVDPVEAIKESMLVSLDPEEEEEPIPEVDFVEPLLAPEAQAGPAEDFSDDIIDNAKPPSCLKLAWKRFVNFVLFPYNKYTEINNSIKAAKLGVISTTVAIFDAIKSTLKALVAIVMACSVAVASRAIWKYLFPKTHQDDTIVECQAVETIDGKIEYMPVSQAYDKSMPKSRIVQVRHFAQAHANNIDQLNKIAKNTVKLSTNESYLHGWFAAKRCLNAPMHFFHTMSPSALFKVETLVGEEPKKFVFRLSDCDIRLVEHFDWAILTLPSNDFNGQFVPEFASILHFLHKDIPTVESYTPVTVLNPARPIDTTLVSTCASVTYNEAHGTRFSTTNAFIVPSCSVPGDCGKLLLLQNPAEGGVVLGSLVSGDSRSSYFAPRPRSIVEAFMNGSIPVAQGYTKVAVTGLVPVTELIAKELKERSVEQFSVANSEGKIVRFNHISGKTKFELNPHASTKLQQLCKPAPMKGKFDGTTPIVKSLRKISQPAPSFTPVDQDLLDACAREVVQSIVGCPSEVRCSRLSPTEAFFGSQRTVPWNLSSSVGLFEGKMLKGRDYVADNGLLRADVQLAASAFTAEPWKYPACGSWKDEIIPAEKADQGKCRLFWSVNGIHNLAGKCAFGHFFHLLKNSSIMTGFMVGTDFSSDYCVSTLVSTMKKLETQDYVLVDGDFAGYDSYRLYCQYLALFRAIANYYDPSEHAHMWKVWISFFEPYIAFGTVVMKFPHIMLSGGFATAEINSLDGAIAHLYVCRSRGHPPPTLDLRYGDDFVTFMPRNVCLDATVLAQDLKTFFNWTLTSVNKDGAIVPYREIKDFSFCKRRLIGNTLVLEDSVLYTAGGWRKKDPRQDNGLLAIRAMLYAANKAGDSKKTLMSVLDFYLAETGYPLEVLCSDLVATGSDVMDHYFLYSKQKSFAHNLNGTHIVSTEENPIIAHGKEKHKKKTKVAVEIASSSSNVAHDPLLVEESLSRIVEISPELEEPELLASDESCDILPLLQEIEEDLEDIPVSKAAISSCPRLFSGMDVEVGINLLGRISPRLLRVSVHRFFCLPPEAARFFLPCDTDPEQDYQFLQRRYPMCTKAIISMGTFVPLEEHDATQCHEHWSLHHFTDFDERLFDIASQQAERGALKLTPTKIFILAYNSYKLGILFSEYWSVVKEAINFDAIKYDAVAISSVVYARGGYWSSVADFMETLCFFTDTVLEPYILLCAPFPSAPSNVLLLAAIEKVKTFADRLASFFNTNLLKGKNFLVSKIRNLLARLKHSLLAFLPSHSAAVEEAFELVDFSESPVQAMPDSMDMD